LVHYRFALLGAGRECRLEKRVHVFDIQVDADGRPAQRLRRYAAISRKFVRSLASRNSEVDFP
jgi:hypothetical protein